jgi:hypothetical protein
MEFFSTTPGLFSLAIIPSVITAIVGWYYWRHLDKSWNQRQVSQVLQSIGVKFLQGIMLPDGIEGYTYIDYLLLTPKGFVVLDINLSEGHLFGGESVDEWTQVVNKKTFKFNNPLYDNQTKCQAVRWNVKNNIGENDSANDDLETHGWIAFSSAGNFPKGIPENISMIKDLHDDLEEKFNLSAGNSSGNSGSSQNILDQLHALSTATHAEAGH